MNLEKNVTVLNYVSLIMFTSRGIASLNCPRAGLKMSELPGGAYVLACTGFVSEAGRF